MKVIRPVKNTATTFPKTLLLHTILALKVGLLNKNGECEEEEQSCF